MTLEDDDLGNTIQYLKQVEKLVASFTILLKHIIECLPCRLISILQNVQWNVDGFSVKGGLISFTRNANCLHSFHGSRAPTPLLVHYRFGIHI